mmetsp:Transcript_2778/g.4751  ORF Transcript_2778/g.4751 Transcript_2778/m.4751 type:complete len:150 (+) Transcript_2778:1071-1520(+)
MDPYLHPLVNEIEQGKLGAIEGSQAVFLLNSNSFYYITRTMYDHQRYMQLLRGQIGSEKVVDVHMRTGHHHNQNACVCVNQLEMELPGLYFYDTMPRNNCAQILQLQLWLWLSFLNKVDLGTGLYDEKELEEKIRGMQKEHVIYNEQLF